jgi:hypothetical protein
MPFSIRGKGEHPGKLIQQVFKDLKGIVNENGVKP